MVLSAGLLGGCSSDDPVSDPVVTPDIDDEDEPDLSTEDQGAVLEEPGTCADVGLHVLRVAPWPGLGLQITVRDDQGETPALFDEVGAEVAHESVAGGESAGLTVLAVTEASDAVTELVNALPDGEQIGLWGGATMLAELTPDKAHVRDRLTSWAAKSPSTPNLQLLTELLAKVAHGTGPVHRSVVTAGFEHDAMAGVVPIADFAATVTQRRAETIRLGACVGASLGDRFEVRAGERSCWIEAPAPLAHMKDAACDAAAAAADDYPYPDTIVFELTEAEQETFDLYHTDPKNKADFELSVRLGGSASIAATAHMRGQSSLGCERNSYTVNLEGGSPRRLQPGAADDRFHLVSLCLDDHYFRLMLSNRVMQPLGLYPLDVRFVRLFFGEEDRGVYMMIEHVRDTLVAERLDTAAVVRRRFDPEDKPEEVKWPKDQADKDAVLAEYKALEPLAKESDPATLDTELSTRIDLDGYVRWLALMTLFENGDYVDEAYFYASRESGALYWRVVGWDSDDLLQPCHHNSKFAMEDPNGVLYCAEGDLDHALLRSDAVYGRFMEQLGLLTTTLTAAAVDEVLDGVKAELFAVLAADETAAAMTKLGAKTAAEAHAAIEDNMTAFAAALESRRADLAAKVEAYQR